MNDINTKQLRDEAQTMWTTTWAKTVIELCDEIDRLQVKIATLLLENEHAPNPHPSRLDIAPHYKSFEDAVAGEYRRITDPYSNGRERIWLESALAQLLSGGIECCVVPMRDGGIELWRKNIVGDKEEEDALALRAPKYLPKEDVEWLKQPKPITPQES